MPCHRERGCRGTPATRRSAAPTRASLDTLGDTRGGEVTLSPQKPLLLTEIPGPKSRALVAAEAPYLAPGTQSIASLSGLAIARGENCLMEDVDGNRFLDIAAGICVNALGHAHPRYRQILKAQIDEVTVGSLTTRPPRAGPEAGRLAHAAGPRQDPAVLRRHRGGRGGHAPRQVAHEEVRVPRLLGRLPRQDRGRRSRSSATDCKNSLGPMRARRAPRAVRRLLPLPARPRATPRAASPAPSSRASMIKHETAGELAAIIDRADPGHGRQHRAAARVPARDRSDRERERRAAHRRRDDHAASAAPARCSACEH